MWIEKAVLRVWEGIGHLEEEPGKRKEEGEEKEDQAEGGEMGRPGQPGKAVVRLRQERGGLGADGQGQGRYLAGLLVHVEGADDALGDLTARALYQVLGQSVGQVGLARAAGAREDKAPVLEQKADVMLHHGLGDERLKGQAVHTLLLQTWSPHRACELWVCREPQKAFLSLPGGPL